MYTLLHQVRVQHPVGHGFFHTSTIRLRDRRFDYAVDCGGVESALKRQVQAFKDGRTDRALDLLVVSHFHTDHVGGLKILLNDLEVRAVAVPYLSPEEKLLCLGTVSRKKQDIENEQFLLRPEEWVRKRGAKIVYFVHSETTRPLDNIATPLVPQPDQQRDQVQPTDVPDEWVLAPRGSRPLRGRE